MGTPTAPPPVKLIMAMLAADAELLVSAISHLQRHHGPVDLQSEVLPWHTTDYYREEMGENLLRQYVAFEPLISPEELVRIKLATNATEQTFPPTTTPRTRRCINLDPGYLDANKLVLASTKGQAHRLYLSQGIYAEITLLFHHGAFHPFLYTYADYRWPATHAFLLQVRKRYLAQLRAQRSPQDRGDPSSN